jgi:hypothetical protein
MTGQELDGYVFYVVKITEYNWERGEMTRATADILAGPFDTIREASDAAAAYAHSYVVAHRRQ